MANNVSHLWGIELNKQGYLCLAIYGTRESLLKTMYGLKDVEYLNVSQYDRPSAKALVRIHDALPDNKGGVVVSVVADARPESYTTSNVFSGLRYSNSVPISGQVLDCPGMGFLKLAYKRNTPNRHLSKQAAASALMEYGDSPSIYDRVITGLDKRQKAAIDRGCPLWFFAADQIAQSHFDNGYKMAQMKKVRNEWMQVGDVHTLLPHTFNGRNRNNVGITPIDTFQMAMHNSETDGTDRKNLLRVFVSELSVSHIRPSRKGVGSPLPGPKRFSGMPKILKHHILKFYRG